MGLSATVRFGPLPEPLFATSVDTVNRKVLDQNGDVYPMYVMSSWGMAMRLSNADITTALEGIHAKGFNVANISVGGGVNVQSDWNSVQYKNQAGSNYWSGTPWASSLGSAWSSVDWCRSECERLGMTMMMSFFVSFGTSGIGPDIEAVTNVQMRAAGVAIATRYLTAPNIVWEVEVDDGMAADTTRGRRIDYLMRGITETETTPRLQFVEPLLNGTAGFEYITGQGTDPTGYQWFHISTDAMYSYSTSSVDQIEAVWGDNTDYPVWDSEPPYAARTGFTNADLRERNYSDFIEGFCAINYGDEDWWRFGLTGFYTRGGGFEWDDVLTHTNTVEAGYAWGLLDTYCKVLDWAPSSFVTTGTGTGDTRAAAGACSTAALAYFPNSRTIQVDTTILSGTSSVRLRWFDPTNNTFTTIAASEAQNATRSVTHPGNSSNSAGASDYVLVVDLA